MVLAAAMMRPIVEQFAAQPLRLCGERLNSPIPEADRVLARALWLVVRAAEARTVARVRNFRSMEKSNPSNE